MGCHCVPIDGEDIFHSGPSPPACCNSNDRTVEPITDSWPLAASACCHHSLAAPKRCCKASSFPLSVPTPCCCSHLLLTVDAGCRQLYPLCNQSSRGNTM